MINVSNGGIIDLKESRTDKISRPPRWPELRLLLSRFRSKVKNSVYSCKVTLLQQFSYNYSNSTGVHIATGSELQAELISKQDTQNKRKSCYFKPQHVLLFWSYSVFLYLAVPLTLGMSCQSSCSNDYTGCLLSVADEGVRATRLWARACVGGSLHAAFTFRRAGTVPFSGRHA